MDAHGYRPNVGLILCNRFGQVLWAKRRSQDGWQFPQGGIEPNETVEEAAYRELYEEIGLNPHQVSLVGRTSDWLHYDVPSKFLRRSRDNKFRGQKQLWFLFKVLGPDSDVRLNATRHPEFDQWRWVEYWDPLKMIVHFKRQVYEKALSELEPLLSALHNREPYR